MWVHNVHSEWSTINWCEDDAAQIKIMALEKELYPINLHFGAEKQKHHASFGGVYFDG